MDPAGVCARLCRAPPKRGERYRRGSCPKEAAFESVFCSAIVRHTQEYREGSRLPRSFACVLARLLLSFFLWEPIVVQACKRAYVRVNARLVGYAIRESKHVSDFSLSPSPPLSLSHSLTRSLGLSLSLSLYLLCCASSFSLFFSFARIFIRLYLSVPRSLSPSLFLALFPSFPFSRCYSRCPRHLCGSRVCKGFFFFFAYVDIGDDAGPRCREPLRSDSVLRVPSAGDTNLARHYAIDVHRPEQERSCLVHCRRRGRRWCCAACFYLCFPISWHDEETLPLPPPPPLVWLPTFREPSNHVGMRQADVSRTCY